MATSSFPISAILPCAIVACALTVLAWRGRPRGSCSRSASAPGSISPFMDPQAREVVALEPAPRLVAMARRAARAAVVPVRFLEASAEAIPLEDASADTVVASWTLCSVPLALAALSEMRRVLKPAGRLLPVDAAVASTERGLSPQSPDRRDDRRGGIPDRATRDRLCSRAQAHNLFYEGAAAPR